MSSFSWIGMAVGLMLAVLFPVGTLYLFEPDSGQSVFLILTVAGSTLGLFLAGLSMSARTWGRY